MHIRVETHPPSSSYDGHNVYIESQLIGHRPYDGSGNEEIRDEVRSTLAEMLCEKLGWGKTAPEEGEPG